MISFNFNYRADLHSAFLDCGILSAMTVGALNLI